MAGESRMPAATASRLERAEQRLRDLEVIHKSVSYA